MTDCSAAEFDNPRRCPGMCCRAIALPYTKLQIARYDYPDGFIDTATRQLILDHFRPLPARAVMRRAPWQENGRAYVRDGDREIVEATFYACDLFDLDTGLCTDHLNRPKLCRDYPLAGRDEVRDDAPLPPSCAYRADLGQPVDDPADWQPVQLVKGDRT